MLEKTCSKMKAEKKEKMQKYWQLEDSAMKCIFERTWSKMKAENRRKEEEKCKTKRGKIQKDELQENLKIEQKTSC